MAEFKHKSLKADGAVESGVVEALDERDAYRKLRDKGLDPFELALRPAGGQTGLRLFQRGPSGKDKARYVRQLATLLSAGLPLLEAIDSMARGGHPQLQARSRAVRQSLRAGERLSSALDKHMPDLPDYVARLAELGESTGTLSQALGDAAGRLERQQAMRGEIRSALTYPAFLAVTGVVITLFMFYFVVPRFEVLIGDNRDTLPLISVIILSVSAIVREHGPWLVAVAAALGAGLVSALRSETGRRRLFLALDRTPLIGPFLRRAELGDWARTMGIALKNGASLMAAFDLAARAVRGPAFADGLREARRAVRAGTPLDEALDEHVQMDPTFTDLLRTGRQAAALDDMLLFISDILDEEARERAKRLTSLAEPLAIVLISLVVGALVLGIVLAMTSIYQFDF
ncbi:MAG: type II secretion system F family protein [Rhodothalassiaceae bacterium]